MTALALVPSRRRVTVRRPVPHRSASVAGPAPARSKPALPARTSLQWPGGSVPAFALLLILGLLAPPAAIVALILRITGAL